MKSIVNEANALSHLKHENIVKLFSIYETKDEVWFCLEYVNRGTLSSILYIHGGIEDEIVIAGIL